MLFLFYAKIFNGPLTQGFSDQSLYKNYNCIDQINMVPFVPLVNFALHTNYINRYKTPYLINN